MNNERMVYLLAYLNGLTKLRSLEYRCVDEIDECIEAIRMEFNPDIVLKDPDNV